MDANQKNLRAFLVVAVLTITAVSTAMWWAASYQNRSVADSGAGVPVQKESVTHR